MNNMKQEFSIENPEVQELAEHLDIKEIDTSNMVKRFSVIYAFYQEHGEEQGLVSFCREVLFDIGNTPGVHPLDAIYSYVLSKRLLKC
jgi:hypothetical protein